MDKIKNPYLSLRDKGYNCFACSPWNDKGLKMEFWEDGDDIVSVWTASEDYQSWTETLHGGIQATLLDEVGGWYVTRKLQTAGVTSTLNIRYRKTVPVGEPLEIRVRLKEMRRNLAVMEGSISCSPLSARPSISAATAFAPARSWKVQFPHSSGRVPGISPS